MVRACIALNDGIVLQGMGKTRDEAFEELMFQLRRFAEGNVDYNDVKPARTPEGKFPGPLDELHPDERPS